MERAPVAVELKGRYTCGMTVNLSKMDNYRPGDGMPVYYAAEADEKAATYLRWAAEALRKHNG